MRRDKGDLKTNEKAREEKRGKKRGKRERKRGKIDRGMGLGEKR